MTVRMPPTNDANYLGGSQYPYALWTMLNASEQAGGAPCEADCAFTAAWAACGSTAGCDLQTRLQLLTNSFWGINYALRTLLSK